MDLKNNLIIDTLIDKSKYDIDYFTSKLKRHHSDRMMRIINDMENLLSMYQQTKRELTIKNIMNGN